ncbi:DUF1566 domain-containing protein [Flavobacterium sp.]|uniref:Lcl domain-containing protein n=1 Tax=Flavobacterium sp. TaxID=239 RepID=UPI00260E0138|nr:DUF1566 domain-containing protein [Flavobacterium sp.]
MIKKLLLLATTFSFAQSVTKTINVLPDTGQTSSYTSTFGEDNDYNINAPSYTNNADGTITDNITGLQWQQADGGEMTIENATNYSENLILGGFSDWRLPSPIESFSILNHQNNNPAMNTAFFTPSAAEYWWTNTYQAGDNNKVWCTNAGGGIGNHPKSETISAGGIKKFHVRAVRNRVNPTTIPNHFTDNGDGTITDNLTQLIWQKTPNSTAQTWENALVYADNLSLANASDWRLPNIKELQSLNDESRTNPSTNTVFFPAIGVHNYWSSTSLPNQTTKAWYWNTQFGITTYDVKSNTNYVICVKGNPVPLAVNLPIKPEDNKVYPNPFSNFIHFENENYNENYILLDNSGAIIYKGTNIENHDFTNLAKGIYFLKSANLKSTVIKLIKE